MLMPLGARVLLKKSATAQTKSGLWLPEDSKKKQEVGTVVAVGPGNRNYDGVIYPVNVEVGQEVLYNAFAGTEVSVNGQSYIILNESDIFGKFQEQK